MSGRLAFWLLFAIGIALLGIAVLLAFWDDLAKRGDAALYTGPEDDPAWIPGSSE